MSRQDIAATSFIDPPQDHSSTPQWQSFEVRMRRRRVERCLLRAEVALEAGYVDDAQAALAEARTLDSSTPELEALRASIVARRSDVISEPEVPELELIPDPGIPEQGRRRSRWAAAGLFLAAAGIVAMVWARDVWISSPPVPVPAPVVAAQASAPVESVTPLPTSQPTSGLDTTPVNVDAGTTPAKAEAEAIPPPADTTAAESVTPPPALPSVSEIPNDPARVPDTGRPQPGVSLLSLTQIAPPSAPAVEPAPAAPAPAPVQVDESARVRAVLAQYESAYTALNVSATRAIWPAVNVPALARAFDGLESQRVSLGRCSVAVEGATARADCNGTASWTPKVGGGSFTEARSWRFELRNEGGSWQIVRAEAR